MKCQATNIIFSVEIEIAQQKPGLESYKNAKELPIKLVFDFFR